MLPLSRRHAYLSRVTGNSDTVEQLGYERFGSKQANFDPSTGQSTSHEERLHQLDLYRLEIGL